MRACAKRVFGTDSLAGKKIAVQGAGHVSYYLVKQLVHDGAKVFITDIFPEKLKRFVDDFGVTVVNPDEIYGLDVDIFSPCALGGILNSETIPQLKCAIVAGCSNNQLDDENLHGQMLIDRNILYAPDYVINAGGLINVANELEGYNQERAHEQASRIYDVIANIITYSELHNVPTYVASNELAEHRLNQIGRIKSIYASRSEYSGRLGELNRKARI
jgi:leucine dehydrogenase